MTAYRQMMIFGLSREAATPDVVALLGPCANSGIRIVPVPGDHNQAFAVVKLAADPQAAWRITTRIERQRLHGRPLRAWVSSMPWG